MGRRKKEKWVYIDMYPIKKNYYKISNWGNIININNKKMKYFLDKDGYSRCTLVTENKTKKHFFVHRLVAFHFIENPENKPEVNHLKPSDKSDLYYKNFEWCTSKENRDHAIKMKLQPILKCESHGMATLTNSQVHKICKLMENGYSNKMICDEFKYTDKKEREKFRGVLKHIRSRKTWKPISNKYKF